MWSATSGTETKPRDARRTATTGWCSGTSSSSPRSNGGQDGTCGWPWAASSEPPEPTSTTSRFWRRLAVSIRAAPGVFDLDRAFTTARVEGSGYLTSNRWPARPTLAVRAGAARVFGSAPFFEGAAVGGRASVRGLNSQRFLGDAAAWAGTEVRLAVGRFALLLPGEWGVFGLTDVGRVWLSGEASRQWHSAGGGGVWFAFLDRRSTMSVTVARSEERTRLYVRAGMHY